MREKLISPQQMTTHFLWLQTVSPCSEQWACEALTGDRPSLPRDVTEIISKEYHVNWSEREKFDGENIRSKYKTDTSVWYRLKQVNQRAESHQNLQKMFDTKLLFEEYSRNQEDKFIQVLMNVLCSV